MAIHPYAGDVLGPVRSRSGFFPCHQCSGQRIRGLPSAIADGAATGKAGCLG